MKPGNLVRIIQSKKHFASWQTLRGATGIVVALYDHRTSTWGEWFTILVNGKQRNIREDHLELINETR